jgi:hypothetical protein
MTRVAVPLLLFALVLIGRPSSAAPIKETDKDAKAPDYYPLKAGSKWQYQVEANGNKVTIVSQVAKIEKIDDVSLARVEASTDGKVLVTEHLRSTDKGVFRHRYNGVEVSPPVCVLRYPIKKDDAWEQEVKIGEEKMTLSCKVGNDEVEVPAGKFKAVTVQAIGKTGDKVFTTTYWFAEGVGIVKQVADFGGLTMTIQLEKYEAGK